jgi:hypothetical protein
MQGAWDGARWAFIIKAEAGERFVLADGGPARNGSGSERRVDTLLRLPPVSSYQDIYLTTSQHRIIAGEFRNPFRMWAIRALGEKGEALVLTPSPELRHSLELSRDSLRWIALSAFAVDSSYVQSLADLNSDTRILARYGNSGEPLSERRMTVPLGFLAVASAEPKILAFRRINSPEFVIYRWEWKRTTTQGK